MNTINDDYIILDRFTSNILTDQHLNKSKLVINVNLSQYSDIFLKRLLKFLKIYNNVLLEQVKTSITVNHLDKKDLKTLKSYQLIKLNSSF